MAPEKRRLIAKNGAGKRRKLVGYYTAIPIDSEGWPIVVSSQRAKKIQRKANVNTMTNKIPAAEKIQTQHIPIRLVSYTDQAVVYAPDNLSRDKALVFSLALRDIVGNDQSITCGLFRTIMCLQDPALAPHFTNAFIDNGYLEDVVKLPSQGEENFVEVRIGKVLSKGKIAVMWSLFVIILLRNVSQENYDDFMERRIRALCACVVVDDSEISRPVEFEQARKIRLIFGSLPSLKEAVVDWIIKNRGEETDIGRACNYLTAILAWTELNAFVIMHETLNLTYSKVLMDSRVRREVDALATAFKTINAQKYPAFSRLFAPDHEQYPLERVHFPNLVAVAIEIKKRTTPSLKNYSIPPDVDRRFITSLLRIHDQQ